MTLTLEHRKGFMIKGFIKGFMPAGFLDHDYHEARLSFDGYDISHLELEETQGRLRSLLADG